MARQAFDNNIAGHMARHVARHNYVRVFNVCRVMYVVWSLIKTLYIETTHICRVMYVVRDVIFFVFNVHTMYVVLCMSCDVESSHDIEMICTCRTVHVV